MAIRLLDWTQYGVTAGVFGHILVTFLVRVSPPFFHYSAGRKHDDAEWVEKRRGFGFFVGFDCAFLLLLFWG